MLITALIGDRSRRPIDQAFDDEAADVLGEVLGVRDRSGLHNLDLVLNIRDHRGLDRSRHVVKLLDLVAHRRMADEIGHIEGAIQARVQVEGHVHIGTVIAPAPRDTAHVLAIIVGDVAAQAIGLTKRSIPTWSTIRSATGGHLIAIPSASDRSRLWKDKARRREVLAQLELAFNAPTATSRVRVSQILGNLLELGSESVRSRIRTFDMVKHRHELGELYLRLRSFDWRPGQRYDVPAWMAKPKEPLPASSEPIDVEIRSER